MTQLQFDKFREVLLYYYGDLAHKMVQKATIGVPEKLIDNDLYILSVLEGYIDIMNEYTLQPLATDDTNFFTRAEMKNIVLKINDILNTNFEIDFVLT